MDACEPSPQKMNMTKTSCGKVMDVSSDLSLNRIIAQGVFRFNKPPDDRLPAEIISVRRWFSFFTFSFDIIRGLRKYKHTV